MELNSDGKIHLEETINESIINENGDARANISDSTFNDSKETTQNDSIEPTQQTADQVDAVNGIDSPTAIVLSIDDRNNGEIDEDHIIANNINNNNNHIPNKKADSDGTSTPTPSSPPQTDEPTTATTVNKITTETNGDVVNIDNDSDNKRLLNNTNTDAANPVGFSWQKISFFFLPSNLL